MPPPPERVTMIDTAAIARLAPDDARLWAALGEAVPAYSTMPTPGAAHDLDVTRVVAHALSRPHMPWQDWATRIATERRLDDPDQYRYKMVIVTVPRQSGKTTLMGNKNTTRCLMQPKRRVFYTAQTGKDATARWKDLAEAIISSPTMGSKVVLRKAIGSQSLTFPNGSYIQPFAPTPKSLHGYTPHDVDVDELFAFDDAQGTDLMGAIGPAQVTLKDRQLWFVSTAGTADSTFLRKWVEDGRQATSDPSSGIAYLEWSQPEGLDPDNPDHWGFHPAVGHTITIDTLKELHAQFASAPGEWRRAFMNLWTASSETIIDMALIKTRLTAQEPPATSPVTIGYEVAMDRSRSAIYAAWMGVDDDGNAVPCVRPVKVGAGVDWVAGEVQRIRDELRPRAIGADDGGTTRSVTDKLRPAPGELPEWLTILGPRDLATGWDQLKAHIRNGNITHNDSEADRAGWLEAWEVVTERTMGQGYAPDRMKSRGPIPELVAATVALRLLEHGGQSLPAPMLRF